jgi:AbiJ N-terminal domain 3
MKISEITPQAIFDDLHLGDYWCARRLDQTAFLARLYPMPKLPSTDRRIQNAEGDIRQHRINNHDWKDDSVFMTRGSNPICNRALSCC